MAGSRNDPPKLGPLGSPPPSGLDGEAPEPWERRLTSALPPRARRPAHGVVRVIVKVARAGHEPAGVRVRARLAPDLFTGDTTWAELPRVAEDPGVVSLALAEAIGAPEREP